MAEDDTPRVHIGVDMAIGPDVHASTFDGPTLTWEAVEALAERFAAQQTSRALRNPASVPTVQSTDYSALEARILAMHGGSFSVGMEVPFEITRYRSLLGSEPALIEHYEPKEVHHAPPGKQRHVKDELLTRQAQRAKARGPIQKILHEQRMRTKAMNGEWTPHVPRRIDV